jgi:hypothetical protein
MTIIASETTFTNASDKDAVANMSATASGSFGSVNAKLNIVINWRIPMIMSQLFLLVPQMGTLSEISPYKILKLHGMWMIDI